MIDSFICNYNLFEINKLSFCIVHYNINISNKFIKAENIYV